MAEDIISTAWVRIRAMGKDLGGDFRKAINDAGKDAEKASRDTGDRSGKAFGDGFTTSADGRLRDSRGRFVSSGNSAGDGFSIGFNGGLSKLAVNVWSVKTLAGAMKSVVAPALLASKAIGAAGAAGAAVALTGGALGVVGALSQIAGVAPLAVSGLAGLLTVAGTVKLATMGVSQAFKDQAAAATGSAAAQKRLAADMKNLAPNARAFVTTVLALKPAFDSLQKGVQNNFFAGMAGEVKSLAATFLPQLRAGLTGLATSLSGLAKTGIGALKTSDLASGGLGLFLKNISITLTAMSPALTAVVHAFTTLGVIGSNYLPEIAAYISAIAAKFNAFVQGAVSSGKLDAFIQGGVRGFEQLVTIVGNLVVGIGHVLSAAAPLGGLLLGKLGAISAVFKTITGSASGKAGLTSFFTSLQPVLATIGQLLGAVVTAIKPLIPIVLQVAQVLGQGLVKVIKDLSPGLTALGKIVLGLAPALVTLVDAAGNGLSGALVSLVPLIKPVAAAFAALAPVLTALISNILTPFPSLLADIAKAVGILAPAFVPLLNILGTLINGVLSALAPVLGVVVTLLGDALLTAVKAIQPVLPSIVAAFMLFGTTLATDLAPLLPVLVSAFAELLAAFVPMIPAFINLMTAGLPLVTMLTGLTVAILPPLMAILKPLLPVIIGLVAAFLLWGNPVAEVALALAAVGIAFNWIKHGPLWAKILGGIALAIAGVTVAMWAVNVAIEANPVVAVITAIVAAIALLAIGIYELVKHFNVVIDFFTKTLPDAFMTALNWIKNSVPDWVLPFVPFIGLPILIWKHWQGIVGSLAAVFTAIKNAFATAFSAIATAASATWTVIKQIFAVGMKVLEIAAKVVFALVVGPFILAWDALRAATRALWSWIGPYVKTALNAVGKVIDTGLHAIEAVWKAIWGAIETAAKTVWRAISSFFTTAWHAFTAFLRTEWQGWVNIATAIWGTIGAPVKAVWRALSGWFATAWAAFRSATSAAWHGFVNTVTTIWSGITAPIKTTWRTISGWLSDAWSAFSRTVGRVWTGIAGKITGAFSGVAGAVSSAWNGIKSAFVTPINWIINHVIDPFLNAISKIPGVPHWHVNPISTGGSSPSSNSSGGPNQSKAFAAGGVYGNSVMPGYTPGRDVHQFYSPTGGALALAGGEGILIPEATRALGGKSGIDAINAKFRGGRGGSGGAGHYLFGGIISGIKDLGNYSWSAAKTVGHGARDLAGTAVGGIVRAAERAASAAIGSVPGAAMFGSMANAVMGKIADGAENFIKGKGHKKPKGGVGDMSAHTASAAAAQAYAKTLLPSHGWGPGQMSPLISLWNGESGWNNLAANPTSSAFGIAQFLDSTWRPYGPKTTDYRKQVEYGEDYIAGGYGTPSNAFAQWSAREPHWYENGGWLNPGATMAMNGTGKREAVMPEDVMAATIQRELGGMGDATVLLAQIEAHLRDIAAFTGMTASSTGADSYGGPTY